MYIPLAQQRKGVTKTNKLTFKHLSIMKGTSYDFSGFFMAIVAICIILIIHVSNH